MESLASDVSSWTIQLWYLCCDFCRAGMRRYETCRCAHAKSVCHSNESSCGRLETRWACQTLAVRSSGSLVWRLFDCHLDNATAITVVNPTVSKARLTLLWNGFSMVYKSVSSLVRIIEHSTGCCGQHERIQHRWTLRHWFSCLNWSFAFRDLKDLIYDECCFCNRQESILFAGVHAMAWFWCFWFSWWLIAFSLVKILLCGLIKIRASCGSEINDTTMKVVCNI